MQRIARKYPDRRDQCICRGNATAHFRFLPFSHSRETYVDAEPLSLVSENQRHPVNWLKLRTSRLPHSIQSTHNLNVHQNPTVLRNRCLIPINERPISRAMSVDRVEYHATWGRKCTTWRHLSINSRDCVSKVVCVVV